MERMKREHTTRSFAVFRMTTGAVIVSSLALAPFVAFAQAQGQVSCPAGNTAYVTPSKSTFCFPDPFAGASIPTIISYIITALLSLVGALFFVMFLWGGVAWLTAGGDAEKVKKARTTLTNAVIGLAIVALSYVLVTNVINVLTAARIPPASGPATPSNIPSRPGDVYFETYN